MADIALASSSALDGVIPVGRFGHATASPGVRIIELRGALLASLIAKRDRAEALGHAVRARFSSDLPEPGRIAQADEMLFIWAGPDRWLVLARRALGGDLVTALCACAGHLAAVCDQSDSRTLLRLSGRCVRDALAKGVPVDLHPTVFTPGSTAITMAAHVGCQLWQIDDAPTYDVAVPRSLAASFLRWLASAAAEFGGEMQTPEEA